MFNLPSVVLPLLLSLPLLSSAKVVDERALPITSTTTILVEATVTETVWWIPSETRLSSAFPSSSGVAAAASLASAAVTSKVASAKTTKTSSASASYSSPASILLVVEPSSSSTKPVTSSTAVKTSSASPSSSSKAATTSSKAAASSKAATTSSAHSSSAVKSSTKIATSTTSSAAAVATTASSSVPIAAAYYPDWTAAQLSPEQIDWTRFDWVDFAFAVLDSSFNLVFTAWDSEDLLHRVVSTGHAAGKKVKLSVGGWTGSAYFSTAMATSAGRTTLAANMLAMYNKFNLDGIDIDWEYPGTSGADGNAQSSADSANYLIFLKLLRATLPTGAKITGAVQVWPFAGSNGNPMSDVSAYAAIFDWVTIMNYDVWGSSSTPGPNAPLSDGCSNSLQPLANAYAAVNSWTNAKFPASQLVLGVAAYGYISQSTATALVDRRRSLPETEDAPLAVPARHRRRDHSGGKKRASTNVVLANADGGTVDGQISFESLVSQGALVLDSNTDAYVGAGGFTRSWDACSSTPFLRSSTADQVITYDDTESLSLKAQFLTQAGLHGFNMWSMDGDVSSWALVDALRSGMGK